MSRRTTLLDWRVTHIGLERWNDKRKRKLEATWFYGPGSFNASCHFTSLLSYLFLGGVLPRWQWPSLMKACDYMGVMPSLMCHTGFWHPVDIQLICNLVGKTLHPFPEPTGVGYHGGIYRLITGRMIYKSECVTKCPGRRQIMNLMLTNNSMESKSISRNALT